MQHDTPEALLAALDAAPRQLTALAHVPEARWRRRPGAGGWSAAEVLGHVRAADDVVASRLLRILARDEPLLLAYDERQWQDVAGYDLLAPARSIATYAARRAELIAALRRQPDEAWQRTGIHELAGVQTLLAIARNVGAHEREHLATIEALLAPPV
jgi:hypothetical protein